MELAFRAATNKAVRDIALGKSPKDIDLATDATPDEMIAMLDKANIKHKPTGLEHGTD